MKKSDENKTSGTKTSGMRTTRTYTKKTGVSTRDAILEQASKIINHTGVVDFRIEALASSLELSPGNITYHFPKKDDIVHAVWDQYIQNITVMTDQMLTPLLDIKQLFLYFRNSSLKAVEKLGVTVYFYGDMGILIQESDIYRMHFAEARKMLFEAFALLTRNGYLKPMESDELKELAFQSIFLELRWWFNHAMNNAPQVEDIPGMVDKYMVMAIYPLLPYLTEKGKRQFDSIMEVLN